MPGPGLLSDFTPDPEAFAQSVNAAPVSASTALGTTFLDSASELSLRAGHLIGQLGRAPDVISADEANAQYGVDGYLRFNHPTDAGDAAFRQNMAHRQAESDVLNARSTVNPLLTFGAGLAGGMVDPTGLPIMLAGGGLLEAGKGLVAGARGAAEAADAGEAVVRAGRVANLARDLGSTVAEGAVSNVPYLGADYALRASTGDDITAGDALRDLAMGAAFHTASHYVGAALGGALDGFGRDRKAGGAQGAREGAAPVPDLAASPFEPIDGSASHPPPALPPDLLDLPEATRQAGALKAIDDAADDRPVDVGRYVDAERQARGDLSTLDERTAEPSFPVRLLDDATAVTPRGRDLPVRYGLAELADLRTSHTDDLQADPAYPQALQPRDRARAGAQARNHQLEAELNPRLLMRDVSAAGGAPIVAPDGTVESGNGRTIALRRSARTGSPAYARYRAELERQGFDTSGLREPVLVRLRDQALSGADRAGLARDFNADTSERLGASEQAMADARRLDPVLGREGDDQRSPLSSIDFTRAFIDHVAPDATNTLADPSGRLSPEGARRIRGALLARAYDDARLVGQVFEGEDSPTRRLGEALADAAPAWARMRAAAAAGDIPRELDLTDALTSATDLVRGARTAGEDVADVLERLRGQGELFGGGTVAPETEAFLRLFFRDARLRQPRAAEKVTAALKDFARQALAVTPGPDLFGATADEDTARQILAGVSDRYARADAGPLDIVRPPGPSRDPAAVEASRPPLLDLREPGGERDGRPGPGGLRPDAGAGAGREGDGPGDGAGQPAGAVAPARGDAIIAADPALKALADDTAHLAARLAEPEPAPPPARDLNTLADAIHAAAVCLLGEL